MMTPQEVSERAFAKATFGGYNMAMVDEFLDQVTNDYSSLYKENALLKSKMKVLVDKVEEYRSTDDAMRKALMSAQKMAEDMVKEAEEKRGVLLRQAEREAKEQLTAIHHDLASEQLRLNSAQQATASFVAKLKDLYAREIKFLESLSQLEAPVIPSPPPPPDPVTAAAEQIEQSVQQLTEDAPEEEPLATPADAAAPVDQDEKAPIFSPEVQAVFAAINGGEEPEKDAPAPKDDAPTMRLPDLARSDEEETGELPRAIDLDNLRFGRDYEIK